MKKYVVLTIMIVVLACVTIGCISKKGQENEKINQSQLAEKETVYIPFSKYEEEETIPQDIESDIDLPSESNESAKIENSETEDVDITDKETEMTEKTQDTLVANPDSNSDSKISSNEEETPIPSPQTTIEAELNSNQESVAEVDLNISYWVEYAMNYGISIGLNIDSSSTGSWDTPIVASSKSIYLERDIKDALNWYKNDYGYQSFWVWSEALPNGKYNIYISYS